MCIGGHDKGDCWALVDVCAILSANLFVPIVVLFYSNEYSKRCLPVTLASCSDSQAM